MVKITSPRAAHLTRGALAKKTGCNIETIRFYERVGLMPEPPRTEGGHRMYSQDHLKRLTFIYRGRELGFSLDEIRGLLNLVDGGTDVCDEVRTLTLDHVDDIRRKISDLKRMERILTDMAKHCDSGEVPECPIVDALFRTPVGQSSG